MNHHPLPWVGLQWNSTVTRAISRNKIRSYRCPSP